MSVEAMGWALSTPVAGTKKLVLIGLANHATAEFEHARPAIATLARYASVHERNVQKALRELEADGWIEKTGEHPVGGRKDRSVAIYRLRGGAGVTPHNNGVALASERGGAGVVNGVAVAPPEPSLSKPSMKPSMSEARSGPSDAAVYFCRRLATQIRSRDPKANVAPDSSRWLNAARLLMERDGRSFDEIDAVLDWLPSDSFWPSVVLSMPKFREKFTQLVAARGRGPQGGSPSDLLNRLDVARASREAERIRA
jgi:Helix-turn-helix domain